MLLLRSLFAGLVLACVARAQLEGGVVALHQACLDATTDALVLNIAAHPDDEADRTLTWLRHRLGVRTVTAYTTCGQGGQNAIGADIGPALARIRVRETLAAARHTGVAVRWLGFPDFGYSKTLAETVAFWGEQELLARMRRLVAELGPDAVLTNHGLRRGHGHHRASAFAIETVLGEVWDAGGSVPLWNREFGVLRRPDWECDPFEFDPVRGATYARQASDGRHQHRTQGPWRPHDPRRTRRDRWRLQFPRLRGVAPSPLAHFGSLLEEDEFRTAWAASGGDLGALQAAFDGFAARRGAEEHVAAASRLLRQLRPLRERLTEAGAARRRLDRRLDALERVVLAGRGIGVEAFVDPPRLARGSRGTVRVLVHAASPDDVEAVGATCRGAAAEAVSVEGRGRHWLQVEFDAGDPRYNSSSTNDYEPEWVEVAVALRVAGLPIVRHMALAAELEPGTELRWSQPSLLVRAGDPAARSIALQMRHEGDEVLHAEVGLELPVGVRATVTPARVELSPARPTQQLSVQLESGAMAAGRGVVRARAAGAEAALDLVAVPLAVPPQLRVGLVRGPDDTLLRALKGLGVAVVELDRAALDATSWQQLSTVVLDIRAYYHRPELARHRERLLAFCAAGGRVVSFYHKPGEWNAAEGRPLLAPYALRVGNARVSEEDAVVTLLRPEHPLWSWPSSITKRDFDGWVQERGLNYPVEWAPEWVPLIAAADRGERRLDTGLLYARHGAGDFVYCSLALYRQLRAGHPGAARIAINLLCPPPRRVAATARSSVRPPASPESHR